MEIDCAGVLYGLKAHIMEKRSHGQDELLQAITRLELEHRIPPGQTGFDDRPPLTRNGNSDRPLAPAPNGSG